LITRLKYMRAFVRGMIVTVGAEDPEGTLPTVHDTFQRVMNSAESWRSQYSPPSAGVKYRQPRQSPDGTGLPDHWVCQLAHTWVCGGET
jgi:hypothetical protein